MPHIINFGYNFSQTLDSINSCIQWEQQSHIRKIGLDFLESMDSIFYSLKGKWWKIYNSTQILYLRVTFFLLWDLKKTRKSILQLPSLQITGSRALFHNIERWKTRSKFRPCDFDMRAKETQISQVSRNCKTFCYVPFSERELVQNTEKSEKKTEKSSVKWSQPLRSKYFSASILAVWKEEFWGSVVGVPVEGNQRSQIGQTD